MPITVETGAGVPQALGASSQIVDTALIQTINTTTTTTISVGTQPFTLASAAGVSVGTILGIGAGSTFENIKVSALSGTSATATFAYAHSGTTAVVANVNRQIMTPGSASVPTNTAEYDQFGNAYAAIRNGLSELFISLAGIAGVLPTDGSGYQFASSVTPGVPLCVTTGGVFTLPVAAGSSTTVVFGFPCIITGYVITTIGTTGNCILYDNENTGSGTKVGVVCGTTSDSTMLLGRYVPLQIPCANGITAVGASSSPAFTIAYIPINPIAPH